MHDVVAFISGGGSGIGEAAASVMAERGAKVALAGRTPDELEQVAERIGRAGGTAITVTCDVSDEDSVREAIATTVAPSTASPIGPAQASTKWNCSSSK